PASVLNPAVPRLLDQILARMLACLPGDRYQTASQLIVDLDRSGLASGLPSFADLDQAAHDPYVRERRAASVQPTRPDLEAPSRPAVLPDAHPPAGAEAGQATEANGHGEVWYLRRRDRKGQWRKAKLPAREIARYLREGRMPAGVEASPQPQGEFRSL